MKKLIGSLLFAFITHSYAINTTVIDVNTNNAQFMVELPANPTTGYQWTVKKYDKKLFNMLESSFVTSSNKLIGAPGQMRFTFALMQGQVYPASTEMMFVYARPWEIKSAVPTKVKINFATP